jgi:hypothetical protein
MATANPPPGALAVENHNGPDPFVTATHDAHRQRYAAFDNSQFSLYLNGTPMQAKRALEAHLAETTRKLQETSHLGNALVQQRKELEEKLKEVDQQHQENDIGPELRQRLAELEKEYNEVGRETARAFLPRSRVPSGETDTVGGASVYSSEAQHSPTKVSVPSRKQRNQQPSRINDVALATEISTSLLSQLKELQAVLLERDEALRAADLDRSQLEIEVEGLSQRLRTLDESESRLKDVNWSLETQVRESEAQSKSTADKEHRLNYALNLVRTEKATLEREVEDLRQQYAKLNDDHINKTKQSETELSSLRRNVTMTETEKNALQRKVEDLSNQNQELAKAVAYRMKLEEHAAAEDTSPDDGMDDRATRTPEHSPPPSPSKATPRHGMLESETLKHSLQHAHRMIQQLKNNIHREKTEKIELKRMLQDARDELETNRGALPGSAGKRRKTDKDVFKKPARPDRLGALRSGTQEVLAEDDDWEEQEGTLSTPSRRPKPANPVPGAFENDFGSAAETSASEAFETANETSDAAFETANERDGMTTETDAFMTGAETLDGGSSDELTETEAGPAQSTLGHSRSSLGQGSRHDSYESTASTSGDEYDEAELRTPSQSQHSRFRIKAKSSGPRRSTPRGSLDFLAGSPPVAAGSPTSLSSHNRETTPAQGKSLFAELNDLSGDEDDDGSILEGTPSRASVLFSPISSPEKSRKSALDRSPLLADVVRPAMVDSGMMTDPEPVRPVGLSLVTAQGTSPEVPRPATLSMSSFIVQGTSPQIPQRPDLHLSSLCSQTTEPRVVVRPALDFSSVPRLETAPVAPVVVPLAMSSMSAHETAPTAADMPILKYSSMSSQATSPLAIPSIPLSVSSVSAHTTQPQLISSQPLGVSTFTSYGTEPIAPISKNITTPSLHIPTESYQTTEPRVGSMAESWAPAALLAPGITSQTIEPKEESNSVPSRHAIEDNSMQRKNPISRESSDRSISEQKPLQLSNLLSHSTEPASASGRQLSTLSTVWTQATKPFTAKRAIPQLSQLTSHATEPLAPRQHSLQVSALSSWSTKPVAPKQSLLQMSKLWSRSTDPVELPKPVPPQMSSLVRQSSEPLEPRKQPLSLSLGIPAQTSIPTAPQVSGSSMMSILTTHATEPVEPRQLAIRQISNISTQHTEPLRASAAQPTTHRLSDVRTLHDAQPESPTLPSFLPAPNRPSTANRIRSPLLMLSNIFSQQTEPSVPSRPVTSHRAGAVPFSGSTTSAQSEKEESKPTGPSKLGFFDSVLPWNNDKPTEPDMTSSADSARHLPLAPITSNAMPNSPRTPTSDGGTQTMVSADQIDKLLLARSPRYTNTVLAAGIEKAISPPPSPSRRHSNEAGRTPRRPGSSGSIRSRGASPPPLPPDHKEVIAAAAKTLPPATPGTMGPPTMPASAYKKRPQTPSIRTGSATLTPVTQKIGSTTPRQRRQSQRGDARSGASSPLSRRSSLSSFTSEIDQRFNIPGGPSFTPNGLPPGATDPRMIQAITQTMIGEYLWKYTRKTGREGLSENRHRRFFWIHPYTRTLYWSDRDPQTAGKTELKGKSVAIEAVQEVEDGNPLPPGLHQKSLLIITPGRSIKFTATTGQRHETWYNALNYLCQRVDEGEQQEQKPATIDEIQDEFNAGYRSSSRATGRSRASMASYVTRRTSSPPHTQVPTLRQSTAAQPRAPSTEPVHGSMSSRFSSILRPTSAMRGSFSSRHSRTSAQESTTYEEPDIGKTDLDRDIQDQVERDLGNMVNVRACCDGKLCLRLVTYLSMLIHIGKHDVGHLHMHSLKGRHSSNNVNSRPSLIGSLSSRSQSRNESRTTSRAESRT